jgi:hypothetical protein
LVTSKKTEIFIVSGVRISNGLATPSFYNFSEIFHKTT